MAFVSIGRSAMIDFLQAHPLASLALIAALPTLPALAALVSDLGSRAIRFLLSTIFVGRELNDRHTRNVLLGYLYANAKNYSLADERYDVGQEPIRSLGGRYRAVIRRKGQSSWQLFVYRGTPIVLAPSSGDVDDPDNGSKPSLRYLRGTLNWSKFLHDAAAAYDEQVESTRSRKFCVNTYVGVHGQQNPSANNFGAPVVLGGAAGSDVPVNYLQEDIGLPVPENPTDAVSVTSAMAQVIEECKFWLNHREWYTERGINWQHGVLIHGGPGTGKTTAIRTVGQILDLPVHVFRLATMDDNDFTTSWNSTKGSPRIVLMEDIDAVFHGRENVSGHDFTFDTLLNAIQGVEQEDGLLLFVTTNHLEHVDPALGRPEADGSSSRPGRIDLIIEMGEMDRAGRLKIARRILQDEAFAQEVVQANPTETPAQLTDRCKRLARDLLWGRVAA